MGIIYNQKLSIEMELTMHDILTPPAEIIHEIEASGVKKANMPPKKLFILAILGGLYVAMSAQASLAATYAITNINIAKIIVGLMFCAGVTFAFVAGAEIFVGNNLMVTALFSKKITLRHLLFNWFVVFIGNFVGGIFVAMLINLSGQLGFSDGLLGAVTIKTAVYKANMPHINAFILGILCNLLICLAVWMASATTSINGKIAALIFPITIFNICGFENSVANMYFIPSGIMAATNPTLVDAAVNIGVSAEQISALGTSSLMQIIPVALGNIVGGGLMIGGIYWLTHKSGLLENK